MVEVTANLNSLHMAPRKVRLLADQIRGMKVGNAQETLRFRPKRAAKSLEKLVASAIANARNNAKVITFGQKVINKN